MVQLAPTARMGGQLLVSLKPGLVVILTGIGSVPLLVKVSVCEGVVEPTPVSGKVRVPADTPRLVKIFAMKRSRAPPNKGCTLPGVVGKLADSVQPST